MKIILRPLFLSLCKYDDTMNLNIYEQHLSYIKNLKLYSSKYECVKCGKLFKTNCSLTRHKSSCDKKNTLVFPGGYFQTRKTIFEE